MSKLRISGWVNDSIVDGPGLRFSLFTQGCPHRCPGCHNPQTHDPKGGRTVKLEEIWKHIAANPLLSGVTLSGGEPFAQARALLPLAKRIHEKGLELACYTGYTFEVLLSGSIAGAQELLSYIDILIDGPFILAKKSLELPFRGSENQRILNVARSLQAGSAVAETDYRWVNPRLQQQEPVAM